MAVDFWDETAADPAWNSRSLVFVRWQPKLGLRPVVIMTNW